MGLRPLVLTNLGKGSDLRLTLEMAQALHPARETAGKSATKMADKPATLASCGVFQLYR